MTARALAIQPPYPVMDAELVGELPRGREWQYEPKWDGFRCLAFRNGETVELQSKSGKPLARYFPDVVAVLKSLSARRFVIDSELVIPVDVGTSFEELQLRLHPAASRVRKLAAAHPAVMIAFDLLVDASGRLLAAEPLKERRNALERFHADFAKDVKRLRLSPATTDLKQALEWLRRAGNALDGIVAKRLDLGYRSGDRTGMVKYKVIRSADCVVGGFRYLEGTKLIGSLLLGLYGEDGLLHHVGFTSLHQGRGPQGPHGPAGEAETASGVHGPCSPGPEPMVLGADGRMGAAEAGPCGRSGLRSSHRRPLPPWDQVLALEAGQGPQPVQIRPGGKKIPWSRGHTGPTPVIRRSHH